MNVTFNAPQLSVDIEAPQLAASTGLPVVKTRGDNAVWAASTITANPVLDVDYETGTITASYNEATTINPIQTGGYADPEDAASVNVRGNTATQLITIGETTYTPSNTPIIIPEGRFLTGNQTISAVAPPYYDMSKEMSWMGPDVTLFKTFSPVATKLSATSYNGWTPSTTAKDILASADVGTFAAEDMDEWEYYILWECKIPVVTTGSPTKKALPVFCVASNVQAICKRPSSWANIENNVWNGNACYSLTTGTFMRYYGSTTNTLTYTWGTSYGFYFTLTAATFSSTTAAEPTVTVESPKVTARCNASYLSTANAALIDQDKTIITIQAKIYRAKAPGVFHGNNANVVKLINDI